MTNNAQSTTHQDAALSLAALIDPDIKLSQVERQVQFKSILKDMMPHLDGNIEKIVMAEIMISLKLEGVITEKITPDQSHMIRVIKESILTSPEKKSQAMKFAYDLLDGDTDE